jgi:hypothetical protein
MEIWMNGSLNEEVFVNGGTLLVAFVNGAEVVVLNEVKIDKNQVLLSNKQSNFPMKVLLSSPE